MANGPIPRNATPRSLASRRGSGAQAAARDRMGRYDERFFKVFQASPVAIILRTLSEGRVVDVNASYTELVGFRREELIGHTVHELGLWVDPSQGERVLDRLRRKGAVRNVEGRFRRKSGDIRDVLIWGELTEIQGETVVIGMIVDITERKRMETELRRSREQLRSLSAHLQQIREEERMRIARELHDELGGFLTVLKLDLAALGKEATTGSSSFRQKIDSMSKAIVRAIGSVRRICSDLRPSVLDHIGLTAGIGWQVEEWQAEDRHPLHDALGGRRRSDRFRQGDGRVPRAPRGPDERRASRACRQRSRPAVDRRWPVATRDPRRRLRHRRPHRRRLHVARPTRHEGASALLRGQRGDP